MLQGRATNKGKPRAQGGSIAHCFVAGLILLAAALPALADSERLKVHLVLSVDGSAYQAFEQGFKSFHDEKNPFKVETHHAEDELDGFSPEEDARVVAVGTQALRLLLEKHDGPLFTAMVPSLTLDRLIVGHENRAITGIFIDQHPARHLKLIKAALPEAERIGMITSDNEDGLRKSFDDHIEAIGLDIQHQTAENRRELITAVETLSRENQALLVVPSKSTQGAQQLRALLLRSFRARMPVFAYSPGLVSAGSLMAVYSTPEKLGREAAEQVFELKETAAEQWPKPRHPKHMEISVNREVARSLGLRVRDSQTLREELDELDLPEL